MMLTEPFIEGLPLLRCSTMLGGVVEGVDGIIGEIKGFYFSDLDWSARYLLLETNAWFDRRYAVVALSSIVRRDWRAGIIKVNLSREQVKTSPRVDLDFPLSRCQEKRVRQYYELPQRIGRHDGVPLSFDPVPGGELRNVRDMIGFCLWTGDSRVGQVSDVLIDETDWNVASLAIDSGDGPSACERLVASKWIAEVGWGTSRIEIRLAAFMVNPARKSPGSNRRGFTHKRYGNRKESALCSIT